MRNVLVFAMLLILAGVAAAQTATMPAAASAPAAASTSTPATSASCPTSAPASARGDLEPVSLPVAGVTISVPKGFVIQPTSMETLVLAAAKLKNDQPVMSVKVSAFPADSQTTLDVFAEKVQPGREDLAVRSYKSLSSRKIKIAGQDGLVRIVTYQFRGVPTTAMMMYFIRPIGTTPYAMAYLIAWEADAENSKQLVNLACRVADTLQLSDPIQPYTIPVEEMGEPVISQAQGFKMAPPKGWKVETSGNMMAVNMFQYDFVRRQRMPQVAFSVSPDPKSPDMLARDGFKDIQDGIDKNQSKLEMMREGPSKVGGVDAYDFVAKNTEKDEKSGTETVIYILGRYVTINNRSYRMIALCPGSSEQVLVGIMDKISANMAFTVPTAATEPTGAAGPREPEKPSSGAAGAATPTSGPHPAMPGAAEPMPSSAPSSFKMPGVN